MNVREGFGRALGWRLGSGCFWGDAGGMIGGNGGLELGLAGESLGGGEGEIFEAKVLEA